MVRAAREPDQEVIAILQGGPGGGRAQPRVVTVNG